MIATKKFIIGTCGLIFVTYLLFNVYFLNVSTITNEAKGKEYLTKASVKDERHDYLKFNTIADEELLRLLPEEEFELPNKNVKIPQLRINENDLPVAIVDEHQEVIPYWFKAVDEGLISSTGNTLIHIDGHSDMATPDDYKFLHKFKHEKDAPESSYLPLMQANDVFIVSAVLKNLINNVIWVKPSWFNQSRSTWNYKMQVGFSVDDRNKENEIPLCICKTRIPKRKTSRDIGCVVLNRNSESDDDLQYEIPFKNCHILKTFKFLGISEDKFIKLINLNRTKNVFIDIDEDYFGVESGVQQLVQMGLPLEKIEEMDRYLGLLCPKTIEFEKELNDKLQEFFRYVIEIQKLKNNKNLFNKRFDQLMNSDKFSCNKYEVDVESKQKTKDLASAFILSLTIDELKVLTVAKYCRSTSPRFYNAEWQLCHGTIYPHDTLNQIYVGSKDEIQRRGKNMSNILQYIYDHANPKFISIARSLRDGYTPRKQHNFIENILLENLRTVIHNNGKQMRIIYDKQLVFGKGGWL